MAIQLLDCTLRDGGYINDWNFTRECYDDISVQMQKSGVEFVELGILGNHNAATFKTKFKNINEIPMPQRISEKTKFTVMMTGNEYSKLSIPARCDGKIDAIRFAFFKADWKEAILQMKDLIDKGYMVFSQTMATYQYSEEELLELVREINKIQPYAFYIVDSFGTFYSSDVLYFCNIVNKALSKNIAFGFHAHNNIQMANANTIQFMQLGKDRDIIVDGSIYGMGRGAGNASIELLIQYLNKNGCCYNDSIVWDLFNKHIKPIREQYAWGYLPEQFLVSKYHTNPAYVWYLSTKDVKDFAKIEEVLKKIPDDKRYTLHKDIIDDILN